MPYMGRVMSHLTAHVTDSLSSWLEMEAECPGPSQPKKQRRDCKFKLEWKSFGVSTSKKGTSFMHYDIVELISVLHMLV